MGIWQSKYVSSSRLLPVKQYVWSTVKYIYWHYSSMCIESCITTFHCAEGGT